MKKLLLGIVVVFGLLSGVYFMGPSVSFPEIDPRVELVDIPLEELDAYIESTERLVAGIKPDNQSRIVWADSARQTDYAIVYLHGFSASPMESNPVHIEMAQKFGFNIYLPRLSQHGLEDIDAFKDLTPSSLVESAKEALAVGQLLGKKVILMSCSTGGTLSIYLSAYNPDLVDAQILFSPNIEIADPTAALITGPWGEQILGKVIGDYRVIEEGVGTPIERYWNLRYHTQGLLALQALLDQTMKPETFEKIKTPYLLGYYYKNEDEKDDVVSVQAMMAFQQMTQTPEDFKLESPFSDVDNHVLASDLQSKDLQSVRNITEYFLEDILKIPPLEEY
ncbi:MAG: alpha/beta hydrolase [Cytophagales bacterium]|nr:alpha/beta hydrolase [Cytophagales bacterium]